MRTLLGCLLVFLVSCGSSPGGGEELGPDGLPLPQDKQEQLNEWLRALYAEDVEVISDHLEMRLSHEVIDRLTIRETLQYHSRQRDQQGNVTIRRYSNTRGGLNHPLEFRIGKARFVVLGTAELRLIKSKQAELDITLRGKVEGTRGGMRFNARRFEFRDGSWGAGQ